MSALILIVEDSELVQQMLQMILEQAGWRTTLASGMAQVLDAIAAETPALVLTDLNLPDLDGQDPVSALRAIDGLAAAPIVLISGTEAGLLQAKARRLGADGAISKDAGMHGLMKDLPAMLTNILY